MKMKNNAARCAPDVLSVGVRGALVLYLTGIYSLSIKKNAKTLNIVARANAHICTPDDDYVAHLNHMTRARRHTAARRVVHWSMANARTM